MLPGLPPPGSSDLAIAAVLLAEGREAEARPVLELWKEATETNPGRMTGNEEALERIQAVLGTAPHA